MSTAELRLLPRVNFLCALIASCFAADAYANPVGPSVVAGQASFAAAGKSLTVTNTPNAIINWQGFSIGAGEITRFQQQSASSAVLNRVVGQDPSSILGTLSSNGRVFLVNPNGVLFGQGSRVDVAGLVATTLNLSNQDFLAGKLNFEAGAVAKSIVNQGEIVTASGAKVLLIAPDVQNHGLINTPQGEVVLAAGKSVQLVEADLPMLKVEVQSGGEALNVGRIIAEGGKVGVYAGLINQRGIVRADSVSRDATGKIVFRASDTTLLEQGSFTSASGAKGGEIQALGNKVGLVGDAKVDASGDAGGGTVLVGGDFQGKNPDVQNAYRTYVAPETSIQADALVAGDGGKVIVWSDDATRAYGRISARGGEQSGNGGFVEVSGKKWLDFAAGVDTSARNGRPGQLLLDPMYVQIVSGSDSYAGGAGFNGGNPDNLFSGGTDQSQISWTTIKSLLTTTPAGGTNVIITTTGNCSLSASCGDIDIVNASPDLAASKTLRLLAHSDINVNGSITNTGGGTVEMHAGWDGANTSTPVITGSGSIGVNQPILVAGTLVLAAGASVSQTALGVITADKLSAKAGDQVALDTVVNMVGTLGGSATNCCGTRFNFKNGQSLTVGSVAGTDGIFADDGDGTPAINVTVTNGNLTISRPVTSQFGPITLAATAGAVNINSDVKSLQWNAGPINITGTSVTVGSGATVSATPTNGNSADVSLTATSGTLSIDGGATVSAIGSAGNFAAGSAAKVTLASTTGAVTISGNVSAQGGTGSDSPPSGGGAADVFISAGGAINLIGSTISAAGGNGSAGGGTGGRGLVDIEAGSDVTLTGGAVNATAGTGAARGAALTYIGTTAGNIVSNADVTTNGLTGTLAINAGTISGKSIVLKAPAGYIRDGTAGTTGGLLKVLNASAGVVEFNARDGVGELGNPVRIFDGTTDVFVANATTGDIALAVATGNVVIDGLAGVKNFNASGTYAITAETGNVQLDIPFKPYATAELTPQALLSGQSVTLSAPQGSVAINLGASIEATGSGAVTLAGGNTGASGGGNGVLVNGGRITTDAGAITITGTGKAGATGGNWAGVHISNPSTTPAYIHSISGAISITGTGGTVDASNARMLGIRLDGTDSEISTSGGSITLTGTGGSISNAPACTSPCVAADTRGIRLEPGTRVTTTGAGGITLNGTGGTLTNAPSNSVNGGALAIGTVTTAGGNISINGTGGTIAGGTDGQSRGVSVAGIVEVTSGAGAISISGTGSTADSSASPGNQYGVLISGAATVRSVSGNVSISGTGGASSAAGASNVGIATQTGQGAILIGTTGTGSVTLSGAGGSSADLSLHPGIDVATSANSFTISTSGRSVALNATGGLTFSAIGTATSTITTGAGAQSLTSSSWLNIGGGGGTTSLSGGDITLTANDMGILGSVTATGTLSILPYTAGTGIHLASSAPSGSAIWLNTTELDNITANSGIIGNASTGNLTIIGETIDPVGNLTLQGANINIGSAGATASAHIAAGGNMTVTTAGTLTVRASDTLGHALLQSGGTQTISANGISLRGGADGGALNNGNYARIASNSTQTITAGSGGISLIGGGGSTSSNTHNFASIYAAGAQSVTVTGGNLTLQGGTSLGSGFADTFTGGSWAYIRGDGATQQVTVTGGSIQITGGENGSNNDAGIYTPVGGAVQSVSATGNITLTAGATGGGTNQGNAAIIGSDAAGKQQSVSGAVISLGVQPGATGTQNSASIFADGPQTVTASSIAMQAGSGGTLNVATINQNNTATGQTQTVTVNGMGGISLTGGSGGTNNYARIRSEGSQQTISATSGTISLKGGDAGGADGQGNSAQILANAGGQSITASALTLASGLGGTNNFALVAAPSQAIDVTGNVTLTGGGSAASADGLIGGGSRIGGLSIPTPSATQLDMTVGGNLTMTGGSVASAGSAVGSGIAGGQSTNITVDVAGNLTMNPGSVANSGSRIGSPAASATATVGGGNIDITAGSIALNSSGAGINSALRTTGTITLASPSVAQTANATVEAGTLALASGSAFTMQSSTINAGTVQVNAGATLNGSGTISGSVTNSGTLAPGTSAGLLTVQGNYTQAASGSLTVEVGGTVAGTDYDQLAVGGTATLGGTLNVAEGAAAAIPGTTYTVITCGSCTGTFATVNSPTINATPTYGATSFTLPFTSFRNGWLGGTDWLTASWSRGVAPGPNDDVVIDDGVAGATTTLAINGAAQAKSITTGENLSLASGSLAIGSPSTVGGTFALSGGTLSGAGSLTTNGAFNFTGGTVANTGGLTTAGTTTVSGGGSPTMTSAWSNSGTASIASTVLTASGGIQNTGTINVTGSGAIRLPSGGAGPAFNNAAGGVVNFNATGGWALVSNPSSQDGIFNNAGTVNLDSSTSWEAAFNQSSSGTVNIAAGQFLSLQNGQTIQGTIGLGTGSTLWVSERHGTDASFNGTSITGSGIVQVAAGIGPVAQFTSVNAPSATLKLLGGGTANARSGTTTFANLDMQGGTLGGAGDLVVTGTMSQTGGSQTGTGSTILGASGTGTLGAVSIARNISNLGALTLGGTSISGLLTNSGTVTVSSSSTAGGGVQQSAGLFTVPAGQTLAVGGGGLALAGGTLAGGGTISGNVNNSGGTVAPGASPGVLTITGNYTQGPSGVLLVDLEGPTAGTQYDQLHVGGAVELQPGSTLQINQTSLTYAPQAGETYTFIIGNTFVANGTFTNVPPVFQTQTLAPSPVPTVPTGTGLTLGTSSPVTSNTSGLPLNNADNSIATVVGQTDTYNEVTEENKELLQLVPDPTGTQDGSAQQPKPPACG